MPPTIRVSARAHRGLENIANQERLPINGVIERLLDDRNALPQEAPVTQMDPHNPPKYATQRHAMRMLYLRYGNDKKKIVEEYVALEQEGHVKRTRNTYGLTPHSYALALLKDGLAKGWLLSKKGGSLNMDKKEIDRPRLIIKKDWIDHGISIRMHDKQSGTTYLYPHDGLIQELKQHAPSIFQTNSWKHAGYYHWPTIPPEKGKYSCVKPFLSKHQECASG